MEGVPDHSVSILTASSLPEIAVGIGDIFFFFFFDMFLARTVLKQMIVAE